MKGSAAHPRDHPLLSVITGTLNEMENIRQFIGSVMEQLDGSTDFELIIVDDGSRDGTAECVRELALIDHRIILVENASRLGLLNSNLVGIRKARGDYCIIMDSDMQHPASAIPHILSRLQEGKDMVIASRYAPGGSVGRRSAVRGLISRVAAAMSRLAVPALRQCTDPVSGFFGFRRDITIPENYPSIAYKTLLHLAARNGKASVAEVPYVFANRKGGDSKIVANWRFILNFTNDGIG